MDLHHHLLPWTTALLKLRNHNSRLLFETHRLNKHLGSVIGEKSQTQSRQKEVYYGHSPYYTVVAGAGFEPTNVAVKVRCLAAWLTRNIMPAGIQVIIEPSQAKSVVPCSNGFGVFPTAGNLCFKTWNSHRSSSPDEAIVQMASLLDCLYYSTLHVALQWTFVAKLIIFCRF